MSRLKAKWKEVRASGGVVAGVTALLGCSFLIYGVGQGLTNLSFDLPFAFRATTTPPEAFILYMDEESHRLLEQPYSAAWDRQLHARLLERLKAASAKAVAFDVLFDTPTTNDAAFLAAVRSFGRVVVGARFTSVGIGPDSYLWEPKKPFPALSAIAAWGVAESPDPDQVVRQHYTASRHSTNLLSLAWRTAQVSGYERLPSPLDLRYVNYYGPPGTIPWRSYVDVLSNNVPAGMLSNKVVFVGALVGTGYTGRKGSDNYPTPYSRWSGTPAAGVEINATAFLNLVRGDWLTRLAPVYELLLVLGAALVAGFLFACLRPIEVTVLAPGVMVIVFVLSYSLMWRQHVWFPWAIISLVQIPCAAAGTLVLGTRRLYQEKRVLEERLASSARPSGVSVTIDLAKAGKSAAPLPRQDHFREVDQLVPHSEATAHLSIPDCNLIRRIGAGAYGEVWLGTNVIGAFRAIKIVHRAKFNEDRPYEREFEGIRHFDPVSRNHPGLVHVLHVGRNDALGYFFYLMELADDASGTKPFDPESYQAKSLASELKVQGRLSVDACLQLGWALADALDYLHSHGLIHRDIKPANIIYVGGRPKLADIGLITPMGESCTFVGTEGFFPPEGPGAPAGDIFSLGKVLYVALTGLPPTQFPDLPSQIPVGDNASQWRLLNKIALRACERDLQKRYKAASEMREDMVQAGAVPALPRRNPHDLAHSPP